jgi:hypothetical protein
MRSVQCDVKGCGQRNYRRSLMQQITLLRTLMKDARGGPQSLAENGSHRLLEMNRHTPRRSNLHTINVCTSRGGTKAAGAQAGSLTLCGLANTAQLMRAFLAAMATIAFQ